MLYRICYAFLRSTLVSVCNVTDYGKDIVNRMNLHKASTTPLFEQVKEDILRKIKSGEYTAGHKIPTELELIEAYDVSRITIRRAIEDLCKEGILIKKQGKGTFVQEKRIFRKIEHTVSFSDSCRAGNMVPSASVTKRKVMLSGDPEIPEHSAFEHTSVVYIQRVRSADNIPVMLENNYYPYDKYSFLLTEPLKNSLYDLLKAHNIKIECSFNSYIDAVKATVEQAALLDISPGDPLFLLSTEIYDDHNQLVYIGRQMIVASRYRFSYENA